MPKYLIAFRRNPVAWFESSVFDFVGCFVDSHAKVFKFPCGSHLKNEKKITM